MASRDSQIDKPQRGCPKRAELLDVNINTGAQSINTERASLTPMSSPGPRTISTRWGPGTTAAQNTKSWTCWSWDSCSRVWGHSVWRDWTSCCHSWLSRSCRSAASIVQTSVLCLQDQTWLRPCLYGEGWARAPGHPPQPTLPRNYMEKNMGRVMISTDWNISVRMLCVAPLRPARRVDSLETVYMVPRVPWPTFLHINRALDSRQSVSRRVYKCWILRTKTWSIGWRLILFTTMFLCPNRLWKVQRNWDVFLLSFHLNDHTSRFGLTGQEIIIERG